MLRLRGLKGPGAVGAILLILAGCAERELILEGERIPVRPEPEAVLEEEEAPAVVPLDLPPQRANSDWTHVNGSPSHLIAHPELSFPLSRSWSADIGRGKSREGRLTSAPVVVGDRVYTLDAAASLAAFTTDGQELWRVLLAPEGENPLDGFGGGVAYGEDTVFATTGFGELIAVNPEDGEIRWRQEFDAPLRAAPTILDGRVFVVARDNTSYGLDTDTGRIKWRIQGIEAGAGLLGGAAPAARGRIVVVPFGSGEVIGALARNGFQVWNVAISGGRRGLARSRIGDISSDPVIDGGTIYVANQSGRLVSIDRRSGERNWTLSEGSYGPTWPVDEAVFLISDQAELLRVDTETGEVVWRQQLPRYARPKRRDRAYVHFGPVLAGGRLLVASSDGKLRGFDPVTGEELDAMDLPGKAASRPAIAGGVLYLFTENGQLHAFR